MNKALRIGISVAGVAAAGGGLFYLYQNGYTWDDLERVLSNAPAWIFILLLLLLPPLGAPLTIFLIAVGARLGFLDGSLLASAAIFAHHLMAVGLSALASKFFGTDGRGMDLWRRLESKVGEDHVGKLVFLFAFVPGPPYIIKLYLPLAMGVSPKLFVWMSTVAHLLGVLLFVGLGGALLAQNPKVIVAFVAALVTFAIVMGIYKRKQLKEVIQGTES